MDRKPQTVTREVLFERVWTRPITQLAEEYGLSDVGLAKNCRRMEVPRPPRGYWQKLKAGREIPKPKLPPLSRNGIAVVEIVPSADHDVANKSAIE